MSEEKKSILINLVIAILIGGGLFFGVFALGILSRDHSAGNMLPPIVITIARPTPTRLVVATPTNSLEESENPGTEGFKIGSVVQIYNTDGAGLRLRSNPGTASSVQFIGEELELFTVVNGPSEQDGYVWWYLESPYDKSRSGWAAANYLRVIEKTD